MRHIQESGITNESVSGDRGAYFLSRRAHLLTTDKVGGVTACGRRALYEVTMITWLKEPTDFYLTSKSERSK